MPFLEDDARKAERASTLPRQDGSDVVDPFALLGLEPRPDLCPVELEKAYLNRSRELHPDRREGEDATARTAALNEAYRLLSDPWRRLAILCEMREPGVLNRCRELPPSFLIEAMERAEEVEAARGDLRKETELEARLSGELAALERKAMERFAAGDMRAVATLCHEARYHRRALEVLHDPGS